MNKNARRVSRQHGEGRLVLLLRYSWWPEVFLQMETRSI